MNRVVRLAVELVVVAVAALVGASLTRTKAFSPEQSAELAVAGAVIALIAIALARLVGERVQELLPPPKPGQVLALRTQLGGFVLAVVGWLVAAYIHLGAGIVVAAVGAVVGAIGVLCSFILSLSENAA